MSNIDIAIANTRALASRLTLTGDEFYDARYYDVLNELDVLLEAKSRQTFAGKVRYKLSNIPNFAEAIRWSIRLSPMTIDQAKFQKENCGFDDKMINDHARIGALTPTGHYLKDWFRWFTTGWTQASLDEEYGRI